MKDKKYYIVFLLFVFLFPNKSHAGSTCNTVVRFVCKDERFIKIKKFKEPKPFDFLILYIINQSWSAEELTDALKGIDNDCEVAKKLAYVSQNGKTPYIRDLAEQSCTACILYFNNLLQFVPDR